MTFMGGLCAVGHAAAADLAAPRPEPAPSAWTLCKKPQQGSDAAKIPDIPGGDVFGFTSPTDVGSPGDCGVAFEFSGRSGKADGSYWSGTLKTQFGATLTDDLSVALSPFVTYHHIRNVPGFENTNQTRFDGLSGEINYRVLQRTANNPVAATVSIEPRWARIDGLNGEDVNAYSFEMKLFLDAVLVPDKLYAGLNLNFAPVVQKAEAPLAKYQRGSGTNLSGALTYQVTDKLLMGVEARYLTAFSGAFLNQLTDRGVFLGPTALWKVTDSTALNIAWTPQIWGKASGNDRRLDLDGFERQQFRIKLATAF